MRSRAIRRHHQERLKRRVEGYYDGAHRHDARRIGALSKTRTPCSCPMCGNPRRSYGERTLQEVRAEEREHLPPMIHHPMSRRRPIPSDPATEAAIAEGLDDLRHSRLTDSFASAEEFRRYRRTPEYQALVARDEREDAAELRDPRINRHIRTSTKERREGKHRPAKELLHELRARDAREE